MIYFADLHIHSRFSRATSPGCNLPELARWAALKGLNVLGTGDFTHPEWNREIRELLEETDNGLFRLRRQYIPDNFKALPGGFGPEEVRFILNVEISSIYKRDGKVRKVHSLVFMPDLESVDRFNSRLDRIGNIKSDGRPILGLDCRNLLEIALEVSPDSFLIPAHVWTPWFSILGSKSGFDSVEECFGDLADHIFALETGLSSDPAMNFMVSSLDRYTLISNSDTHSPAKLGREANIFAGEPGYLRIREAIRSGGSRLKDSSEDDISPHSLTLIPPCESGTNRFLGTLEFFPEEGKYHLDGHRKCAARLEPSETERLGGRCPVCGQAITVGVMNRVNRLADRGPGITPERGAPFWRLLPLLEVVAQVIGVGPQSKRVQETYWGILARLGPELPILWSHSIEKLAEHCSAIFVEAIRRVRNSKVHIKAGFDGEYGTVELFTPEERERLAGQENFFPTDTARSKKSLNRKTERFRENPPVKSITAESSPPKPSAQLNDEQLGATTVRESAVIVQAGPGAGKTLTLTHRIYNVISQKLAEPHEITAVTFTRKAATEIRERLTGLIPNQGGARCWVGTFHQLGMRILDVFKEKGLVDRNNSVISANESLRLFRTATNSCSPGIEPARVASLYEHVSRLKQNLVEPTDPMIEPDVSEVFLKYEALLCSAKALDLDDLISVPVRLMMEYHAQTRLIRSTWSRYLLVDEFQDINRAQYEMVRLLVRSGGEGLFVIGDPDQAIYGFRGANRDFFLRFAEDFPSCAQVTLTRNYRSQANIIKGASVILGNHASSRKIVPEQPRTTAIRIIKVPDANAEAKFIVRTIESMIGGTSFLDLDTGRIPLEDRELGFKDFAVLFRLNSIGDSLEKAFQMSAIPFQRAKKSRPEDEADSLDPRAEAVALMTIHASKGLEFPVVFVAGCEDGVLPYLKDGVRQTNSSDLDEELRLLYVAMTRAGNDLFLTHTATRTLFGRRHNNSISRFVSDVVHPAFRFENPGNDNPMREEQTCKQVELFT